MLNGKDNGGAIKATENVGVPCDTGDCPYNAVDNYSCRDFCGVGCDTEDECDEDGTPPWGDVRLTRAQAEELGYIKPAQPNDDDE